MGAHRAEHSEEVAATPQACFDAVSDFAAYPAWSSAVQRVEVHEDGLVEFWTDAKVRTIRYVLRYHADPPGRLWWDYVEGDARSVEGEYRFEALGENRTRMTYRLAIDPGAFLPGPVKKALVEHVMKGSVRDLKAHVERG